MASRRVAFLAARDRTHGKEAMASLRAEFIIVGVGETTPMGSLESLLRLADAGL